MKGIVFGSLAGTAGWTIAAAIAYDRVEFAGVAAICVLLCAWMLYRMPGLEDDDE